MSKLSEHAVFDQMQAHLSSHGLDPIMVQSAYRQGQSTETRGVPSLFLFVSPGVA